jgi:hypothetical protein
MKATRRAVRVALAALRPFFWLLPEEFRLRNAGQIRAVLEDVLSESLREGGAVGVLRRWLKEAVDLAGTGARLHFARADHRARTRGRKTSDVSTGTIEMNGSTQWQPVPRAMGIACAVGSTGLGLIYLAMAGAPPIYLAVNGLALAIGLGVISLAWTGGRNGHLPSGVVLFLAIGLLATALFGLRVDGAARWVRIGGVSVQISLVVLPAMLVSFARQRNRNSTFGIALAALALAIQPDRAMAGVLASALAVLAVWTRDPRAFLALLSGAAGFAATLIRPDNLPAVPYVDQVLYDSFEVGLLAGLAVTGGAFLLVIPAILGWRYDPDHREVYAMFGVIWLGVVGAAALGNYPTPFVGYGGSAILGYALSLSLIPKLRHSTPAVFVGEARASKGDLGPHLRFRVRDGSLPFEQSHVP